MAENLKQYLAEHKCKGFTPAPHYFANGDFVTYYFRNDRAFARRIDDLLTVYLAEGSNELVGCKIKGVKHILEQAGSFGVLVKDGPVRLGLFFFVGALLAKDESQKEVYEALRKVASDIPLAREPSMASAC